MTDLDTLRVENERLRAALAALQAENARIGGELERVRRERDAFRDMRPGRAGQRRQIMRLRHGDNLKAYAALAKAANESRDRATAAEAARDAALGDVERLREVCGDVFDERQRQIAVKGWTLEHDDRHTQGELARASAFYALRAAARSIPEPWTEDHPTQKVLTFGRGYEPRKIWHFTDLRTVEHASDLAWPFDPTERKSADARRMLIKAGALILAEIERFGRARVLAETAPADGGES